AVTVEHKPTAEYPEAAEVISGVFYKTLGYIKKELAFKLLCAFGNGYILSGKITAITGDGNPYGCNIEIQDKVNKKI
ncbi:MAG: hypothetical protein LBP26_04150, partial [Clostridiales bacterium]|nr:hypothetical protein [Clostridiales bacterium]